MCIIQSVGGGEKENEKYKVKPRLMSNILFCMLLSQNGLPNGNQCSPEQDDAPRLQYQNRVQSPLSPDSQSQFYNDMYRKFA